MFVLPCPSKACSATTLLRYICASIKRLGPPCCCEAFGAHQSFNIDNPQGEGCLQAQLAHLALNMQALQARQLRQSPNRRRSHLAGHLRGRLSSSQRSPVRLIGC